MLAYMIRLDDACENMDTEKWLRIENLLNKYDIKPIVGIIPDSSKSEFKYEKINDFWSVVAKRYVDNNWIIAQHGTFHKYFDNKKTEFAGESYEYQSETIKKGNEIMRKNGIIPSCFFAPAHSFDDTTIDVCRDSGLFDFISDGFDLRPFIYRKMLHIPSIFDTPHKILPFGVYTFIYHPNNMTESSFQYLENFIIKHKKNFIGLSEILSQYKNPKKRSLTGVFFEKMISLIRKIRKK